jgi:DNA-binding transcriptional ArsR family regulator
MSARRNPGVDVLFAALADPARRRAVEILGQGPQRAGDLASRLGLAPPAMSRHLKELKGAGLVVDHHPESDARVRVYALNTPRLAELKEWLARAEEGWTQQLGAFAAHVRKRTAR